MAAKKVAAKVTASAEKSAVTSGTRPMGRGAVCPRCNGSGKDVAEKGATCSRCIGGGRIVQMPPDPKLLATYLRERMAEADRKVLVAALQR